jgi:hypothetical protein
MDILSKNSGWPKFSGARMPRAPGERLRRYAMSRLTITKY